NGDKDKLLAKRHFSKAEVDQAIYSLYVHAYVQSEGEKLNYIGRIVEFFESDNKEPYFRAQWFFRPVDTILQESSEPSLPSSSKECSSEASEESEMKLLDLYSGCGAMSTGLCLGAATSGVKLVTSSTRHQLESSISEEDVFGDGDAIPEGEYEVGKILDICYGNPNDKKKPGLYYK
ncbi:hypothetical protein IFM89_002283, partial [Coptis chinensis]